MILNLIITSPFPFNLTRKVLFIRREQDFFYQDENEDIVSSSNCYQDSIQTKHGQFICKIIPYKDIYEIELNNQNKDYDIDDIPWLITRYVFNDTKERGYILHEGDLMKLGKFILRIRQIILKKEQKTMIELRDKEKFEDEDLSKNILSQKYDMKLSSIKKDLLVLKKNNNCLNCNQKEEKYQDKPTCRICLGDEHEDNNPLINPCKCSGTMKYLHLSCLRQLIESKIKKTVGNIVTVITFKTLQCEICKSLIPENIKIKNKVYTIIDLNRPETSYIVLEGLIKETPDTKSIFVISLKNSKPVKIGRASNADLRLSDISVSRNHAGIILYDSHCILIDRKSKFGTLVNAGNKLCVLPNKPLCIQRGNITLRFYLQMKMCPMLTCYKPKRLPYKSYNAFFSQIDNRCKIKDIPNFLWTDTQIVSEYEDESQFSSMKKNMEKIINSNGGRVDSKNKPGDRAMITGN